MNPTPVLLARNIFQGQLQAAATVWHHLTDDDRSSQGGSDNCASCFRVVGLYLNLVALPAQGWLSWSGAHSMLVYGRAACVGLARVSVFVAKIVNK